MHHPFGQHTHTVLKFRAKTGQRLSVQISYQRCLNESTTIRLHFLLNESKKKLELVSLHSIQSLDMRCIYTVTPHYARFGER